MSANSAPEPARELCERCTVLFSSPALHELDSETFRRKDWFRHSQLATFGDRPDCCFCRFLWEEDLLGASSWPRRFRRLRDLVHPPPGIAKMQNAKSLPGSWVAISCHKLPAQRGQLDYVTTLSTASDDSSVRRLHGLHLRIETATGRVLWDFPYLPVSASAEDPCASMTNLRPLKWDGLNHTTTPLLKAMLNRCETSHARCQPLGLRPLPSRLVHVPSDYLSSQEVRLHVTPQKGQLGQYAALSYCWGGPQAFRLHQDNLDTLQHEPTPASALPQTFQDAIVVTHHLGLEYLWIDALCIVQDSAEDKSREIAQMQDIYQNAAVTIAAATSSSVDKGFLDANAEPQFSNRYASCSVPVTLANAEDARSGQPSAVGTLTIQPLHVQNTTDFPINKRGWTYREALLAPRLLVFGDLEPFLRCQTKTATTAAPTCVSYNHRSIEPPRLVNEMQSGSGYKVLIEEGEPVDLRLEFRWPRLVEQYTHRELGIQADRPHAIAGVVGAISRITGDACRFGIWKSCPVACLLWAVVEAVAESARLPGLPTWSWMSVTAAVELDRLEQMKVPEATVEWHDGDSLSTEILCLSCRVLEADAVSSTDLDRPGLLLGWTLDTGKGLIMSQRENRLRPPVYEPLFFLILARQTNQKLTALMATSPRGGVYRRCGIAELKASSMFASRPQQKIQLE